MHLDFTRLKLWNLDIFDTNVILTMEDYGSLHLESQSSGEARADSCSTNEETFKTRYLRL